MSGIVGVYSRSASSNITPLLQWITHRGPAGKGVIETAIGALGHTRLALAAAEDERQPRQLDQFWIGLDGAIYNAQELRQRYFAEEPGPTRTDAELVLHLYRRFGVDCALMLEGMFAVAVCSDEELFLARDPLGIKPLYYGEQGNCLYFASEIKALTPVVKQIREFPAGHFYHSRQGWHKYYGLPTHLPAHAQVWQTPQEALPLIRSTLRTAVQRQLLSAGPLGVRLSGGINDSIVALLAREGSGPLYSFTVGMEGDPALITARAAADFLGIRHADFVYTERDLDAILPDLLYYLESFDPALVQPAIADYFLAQLAAEQVKVLFRAEGADELYAGYDDLRTFTEPAALQTELMTMTTALHHTALKRADRMAMAHGVEVRVPFLDTRSVDFALSLPPAWKIQRPDQPAKALLWWAFADQLPSVVIPRLLANPTPEADLSQMLRERAAELISDSEFASESLRLKLDWHYHLPNKEALYYYKILREFYRDEAILPSMGCGRSR